MRARHRFKKSTAIKILGLKSLYEWRARAGTPLRSRLVVALMFYWHLWKPRKQVHLHSFERSAEQEDVQLKSNYRLHLQSSIKRDLCDRRAFVRAETNRRSACPRRFQNFRRLSVSEKKQFYITSKLQESKKENFIAQLAASAL